MADDDVWLLTVSAAQFGNLRQNTLAFIESGAATPDAAGFATLAIAMKELNRTRQSSTVTYTGWRARQIAGAGVVYPETGTDCTPVGGLFFEGLFTSNQTGEGVSDGDALPPQCALVTKIYSGLIGRSHRGRHYAFGFSEGNQSGGTWTSGLLTPTAASWTSFFGLYGPGAAVATWQLGIWSTVIATGCRRNPDGSHTRIAPPHPELAFTTATGFVQRSTVFTQRRRVTGVGL